MLRDVLAAVELDHSDGVLRHILPTPLESRNYKWSELPAEDLAVMNRVGGDTLRALGYSV